MSDKLQLSIQAKRGDMLEINIDQTLDLSGITVLFGSSGAGKSSLLRMVAGFDRPDKGVVKYGRSVWFDAAGKVNIPAHQRGIGYIFQSPTLFSHLSVSGNLKYAQDRSGTDDNYMRDIIKLFDLEPLLNRDCPSLSGGETQRVALARSLLSRPKVLLMDEPLSALDRRRKREIIGFLKSLPEPYSVPIIYVTHDVEEACALADNLVLIEAGKIIRSGPANTVVDHIDTVPLATNGESFSVISGQVSGIDETRRLMTVTFDGGRFELPLNPIYKKGDHIRLIIDSASISIALSDPTGLSIRNSVKSRINSVVETTASPHVFLNLQAGQSNLRAQITRASFEDLGLTEGQMVYALVKSVSLDRIMLPTT